MKKVNYAQIGLVNFQRSFNGKLVGVGFELRSVQLQILSCFLVTTPQLPASQMKVVVFLSISMAFEYDKRNSGLLLFVQCASPKKSIKEELYYVPLNSNTAPLSLHPNGVFSVMMVLENGCVSPTLCDFFSVSSSRRT